MGMLNTIRTFVGSSVYKAIEMDKKIKGIAADFVSRSPDTAVTVAWVDSAVCVALLPVRIVCFPITWPVEVVHGYASFRLTMAFQGQDVNPLSWVKNYKPGPKLHVVK